MTSKSLYIHVPFCKRRCPYCDFVVHIDPQAHISDYLDLCIKELQIQVQNFDRSTDTLTSIYFGGGTPSLAPAQALASFVEKAKSLFEKVQDNLEITLECNPENTDLDFGCLQGAGFNRLSVGAQSLRNHKLHILGRLHRSTDVLTLVERARVAGFRNISLDLMFGTPTESQKELAEDLQLYRAVAPEHISSYELTIEKGTHFYEQASLGKLQRGSDSEIEDQMLLVDSELSKAGFGHYEISNFAKPGFESKHNSAYWEHKEYYGVGVGAHSFLGGIRQGNVSSLASYATSIAKSELPMAVQETLTLTQKANELLMFGFRTKRGLSFSDWNAVTGTKFKEVFDQVLNETMSEGFYELSATGLTPALRGMMVADALAARFMEALPLDLESSRNPTRL